MLAIKSVQNRELYRGVTEIRDCTLAEALASHLRESQQVTSGLKIYVCQNDENEQVARGLLWEQLPGEKVGGDSLDELELTRILEAEDFDAAITNLCTTESGRVLSHQALYWSCPCSMERVEVVIRMLGSQSLKDMILEDEPASVNCHFCNSTREVTVERLRELLDESDGQEP
jgi:molecular chaperone Hsp33